MTFSRLRQLWSGLPYGHLAMTLVYLSIDLLYISPLQVSAIPKGECPSIVKLYQAAVTQYDLAQKSYLKAGCVETRAKKGQCKGLEAAAREMRATVEMFATRANSLKCHPQDATKKPIDRCQRYRSLAQRSTDKLKVLRTQYSAQRCYDRSYASPCKALDKAMNIPREVIKAARRDALKAGCAWNDQ